jgi:hypothetical protein
MQQPPANLFAGGFPTIGYMRTIEAVRLENFRRLVAEVQGDDESEPTAQAVGDAVGVSSVYAWQLMTGKRANIDSKAARKMEASMEKPEGWMDTDFQLWPFPDVELLAQVERLNRDQRIEVQGTLRDKLAQFVRPTPAPSMVLPHRPPKENPQPDRNNRTDAVVNKAPPPAKKGRKRE